MHGRIPKAVDRRDKNSYSGIARGHTSIHDYEYRRCGVGNIFLACEPLAGRRMVKITETKTKRDRAYFLEKIAGQYENA